jgi:hypothetical protein
MINHYDVLGNVTPEWLRAMREMEADCDTQIVAVVALPTLPAAASSAGTESHRGQLAAH